MKMRHLIGLAAVLGFVASAAVAQVYPPPQLQSAGQNDLTNVIPNGVAGTPSLFYSVPGIGGLEKYSAQTPLTAFAITVPAHTSLLYLTPAGTLATGTLTFEAAPSDGQRFCLQDTQTQTAITIAANTGQTLGGLATLTALVANTKYCWLYQAPLAQWTRIQ